MGLVPRRAATFGQQMLRCLCRLGGSGAGVQAATPAATPAAQRQHCAQDDG